MDSQRHRKNAFLRRLINQNMLALRRAKQQTTQGAESSTKCETHDCVNPAVVECL
jgi:hypothetical protein